MTGFFREMADAWEEGGRPAGQSPRPRDAPKPAPDGRPPKPTPIKFGRYLDRRTGSVGKPLLFFGEKHLILHGLARAGKQTRLLSELAMTSRNRSLFWIDTKGTVTITCGAEMARHSKFRVICPYPVAGIEKSDGFNPLLGLDPDKDESFSDARAIVDAICERMEGGTGAHFSDSGSQLSTGGMLFEVQTAKAEGRTPSLVNVARKLMQADKWGPRRNADGTIKKAANGAEIDDLVAGVKVWVKDMIDKGSPLVSLMASRFMREAGQDEIAGIISTAITQLTPFLDPCIERSLSVAGGVDLRALRDEPTCVMVVLPPNRMAEQTRWMKLLLSCAIRGHYRPGKYSTLFVLDEFRATVGNLPILIKNWAVVPEYGMAFFPIVQSLEHLATCWGDEWQGMVAQAGIVATIGPTGDKLSNGWMADRTGETTLPQAGFSASGGSGGGLANNGGTAFAPGGVTTNDGTGRNANWTTSQNFTVQQMKRKLILPQDFDSLRPGEGRLWVAGEGRLSVPYYAPNFWTLSDPWVARMKPNPLFNG